MEDLNHTNNKIHTYTFQVCLKYIKSKYMLDAKTHQNKFQNIEIT